MKRGCLKGFIVLVCCALVLVGCVLLGVSFSGVEYHEMGFIRSRTTGAVDTSKVYFTGRYLIGPDKEFKLFRAYSHNEQFRGIKIATKDRLQIGITVYVRYFLRPYQLRELHNNFDLAYRNILYASALDAMKNTAIIFSTREYIRERTKVEKALFKAVRERLGGKCCEKGCGTPTSAPCADLCKRYSQCVESDWGLFADVRYVQLAWIAIPKELDGRFLRALVLQERNFQAKLLQEAITLRKLTDKEVKEIDNESNQILKNAGSQAALITSLAKANATLTRENARREGLKFLYQQLNITNAEERAAFDYLRTLRRKGKLKLAIDYQHYLAGPMSGK